MGDRSLARGVFLALAALNLAQVYEENHALPARVASHFNAAGIPNGWMPRHVFVAFHAGVILLLTVVLWLSSQSAASGQKRLNLPHRDYWLAPERRAATLDAIAAWGFWFGAGTFALMLDMFRQVQRYNQGLSFGLEHPIRSLGVYLGFAVALTVWLVARFARVPQGAP